MSWKPLLVALLLALPTLLVASPAAIAQDTVPIAPSVRWEPLTAFQQSLYVNYRDVGSTTADGLPSLGDEDSGQPDCQSGARLAFEPRSSSTDEPRGECGYPATVPGQGAENVITYATAPLVRAFNVSGNTALTYVHEGSIPSDVTLHVEIRSGDVPVAATTIPGEDLDESFTVDVPILAGTSRDKFAEGRAFVLALWATVPQADDLIPLPGAAPTWTIKDTGSRVVLRADDAVRAATWVTDENGVVRDLFRPVDGNATSSARLVGFFALDSAFGAADARGEGVPRFILSRHGEVVPVPPNNDNSIVGAYNASASQGMPGIAVWSFPQGRLDYKGFQTGEYRLDVSYRHYQESSITRGTSREFLISNQAVSLRLYEERNLAVVPLVAETPTHEVAPGNTTTYLLVINNTGAVNDTFIVDATLQSGTPATGWSALVGGPQVRERRVELAPNESKVVTVTVTAPAGAAAGNSAVFHVLARSSVDPEAKSEPLALIPTIATGPSRAVGSIVLTNEFMMEPGTVYDFPVYVWNRGTTTSDLSLELDHVPITGWDVNLLLNGLPVSRVVVPNVRPGDIAEVTLRAKGPINAGTGEHPVLLRAADNAVDTILSERPITLKLEPTAGVKVEILSSVSGQDHVAELKGNFSVPGVPVYEDPRCENDIDSAPTCYRDGVDGLWFRTWVTNTGRTSDNFTISVASPTWATNRGADCSDEAFVPRQGDDFRIYWRNVDGTVNAQDTAQIDPGDTREFYVWRPVRTESNPCDDENVGIDFFDFVVVARGATTSVIGTAPARAIADNTEDHGADAVHLELAKREIGTPERPESGPFRVDTSLAREREATGYVEVNGTISYFVRVTNAATWSTYLDADGDSVAPVVNLSVGDFKKGWNVSMRPRNGVTDEALNPWKRWYEFSNDQINGRREGWTDVELEVRVEAPKSGNASALVNEQDSVTIRAQLGKAWSSLKLTTIISPVANVSLSAERDLLGVHAGKTGALLMYVNNTGAVGSRVTFRAGLDEGAPDGWRIEPASQTFELGAFKNRTIALLVTPPAGAPPRTVVDLNVSVEYVPNPNLATQTLNVTTARPLVAEVFQRGSLELVGESTSQTIAPGGSATLTFTLRNTGTGVAAVPFQLMSTEIPQWDATISASSQAPLEAGEERTVVYVLTAPATGVTNATSYASVVRVQEVGIPENFDQVPVTINIQGGSPSPSITVDKTLKTVARDGTQAFQVNVRNLGTAAGTFRLETRIAATDWAVSIQDAIGNIVGSVTLGPNEVQPLNVTVRAPLSVPERTTIPLDIIASTLDLSQSARVTVRAQVQDYGVNLDMATSRFDIVAGAPTEFILKLRNEGNDNDTLNVSAHLVDLPDWSVQLSTDRVRLEPNQETEIRAIVRSPTEPLPPARSYSFKFFAGTLGGAAVNLSKNDSVPATLTVLNYRAMDVDGDERKELAVDKDKDASNGFESFHDVFSDGLQSVVVAQSEKEGKMRFFLDVPDDGYDGLADRWFDPESVYTYTIVYNRGDLNEDGTPEYLLDTDRDRKIDSAYETESQSYWDVIEIKVETDEGEKLQFLVDVNGDGRPDRFYDPEANVVTRTKSVKGEPNLVGLDTDKDDKVDKYYDTDAKTVTDANLRNVAGFAREYFYFILAFVAMVVLTVIVLVVRKRRS